MADQAYLQITDSLRLPLTEVEVSVVRAHGAGGQHINKNATAVHLRFAITASSLPQKCKQRLCDARDGRISRDGVVVIKAQRYRSREHNMRDALDRLAALIRTALSSRRYRVPTVPGRAARRRRLESKVHRGRVKALRGRVSGDG